VNLVLLVEGSETEPKVYRAWLGQRLPGLARVPNVADLTTDGYVLVSGKGYPSCYGRLEALLRDIDDHPGKVNAFWFCLDSDEDTYEARYAEAQEAIAEAAKGTRLAKTNPLLEIHVIVQHCCIETWFLGHEGFLRAGPQSRELVKFKRFYDVSADDPELMGAAPGYVTRQSFHLAYLREMLAERSHRYSKISPGVVLEPSYFDALRVRCERRGHLPSFRKLLDAFAKVGGLEP
jgi:hypothetical protein